MKTADILNARWFPLVFGVIVGIVAVSVGFITKQEIISLYQFTLNSISGLLK